MKECQKVEVKWINEVNGHYGDDNFVISQQNIEIPNIGGMPMMGGVNDFDMLNMSQPYDMTAHIEANEDEEQDSNDNDEDEDDDSI